MAVSVDSQPEGFEVSRATLADGHDYGSHGQDCVHRLLFLIL